MEQLRFCTLYEKTNGNIEEARKLFATGGVYNSKKHAFATLRSNLEENNPMFWPDDFVSDRRGYERVSRIEVLAYLDTRLASYWEVRSNQPPPPAPPGPNNNNGAAGAAGAAGSGGGLVDAAVQAQIDRLMAQWRKEAEATKAADKLELAALLRELISKQGAAEIEPTSDIQEQDLRDLFRGMTGGNPTGPSAQAGQTTGGGNNTAPRPAGASDRPPSGTLGLEEALLRSREGRSNSGGATIQALLELIKGPKGSDKEEGGSKKTEFIKDNLVKGLLEPKPRNLEWRYEDGSLTAKQVEHKPFITAAAYMLAADKIEEKHMKEMATNDQTEEQVKLFREEHRIHIRRILECFDVYTTESIMSLDNAIRDLVHQKKRKFSDDYADLFVFHMTDSRIRKSHTGPNQWEPNKRPNYGGGGGGFKGNQGGGSGPSHKQGGGGGNGGKPKICDFFNKQKGCDRGAECRFDHRCKLCKQTGHGAAKCPSSKRD